MIQESYILSSAASISKKNSSSLAQEDDKLANENWIPRVSSVLKMEGFVHAEVKKATKRETKAVTDSFFDTLHPRDVSLSEFEDFTRVCPVKRPKSPVQHVLLK